MTVVTLTINPASTFRRRPKRLRRPGSFDALRPAVIREVGALTSRGLFDDLAAMFRRFIQPEAATVHS